MADSRNVNPVQDGANLGELVDLYQPDHLQQLWSGVAIVAIPSKDENPDSHWVSKATEFPAHGSRAYKGKDVSWLKDQGMLPHAIPEARVLWFRYNPRSIDNDLGRHLFDGLKNSNIDRRLVLFIAHDSGINIIRSALEQATGQRPPSIVGIIHLGRTPMIEPELSDALKKIANTTLLQRFYPKMHAPQIESNVQLSAPDAPLIDFPNTGLERGPGQMSKFWGPGSNGYKQVRDRIVEFIRTRQLLDAAANNNLELATAIIQKVTADLKDGLGETALHAAVRCGHLEMTNFLLQSGTADIKHRNKRGLTALHIAVERVNGIGESELENAKSLIVLLLENGAEEVFDDHPDPSPWNLTSEQGVLDLKKSHDLVMGPPLGQHTNLKPPTNPDPMSIQLRACKDSVAHRFTLFHDKDRERFQTRSLNVYDFLYGTSFDTINDAQTPNSKRVQWYHLPANNETWVNDLFVKLKIPDATTTERRQQGRAPHSRFMRPQCKISSLIERGNQIAQEQNRQKQKDPDNSPEVMTLFTPYVTFEMKDSFEKMSEYLNKIPESEQEVDVGIAEESDQDWEVNRFDRNLIQAYSKGGLHPRRSLDQYYYHMVDDTRARDADQVVDRWAIDRWAKRTKRDQKMTQDKPPHTFILVVDQLWLWLYRDIVITSFPQSWGERPKHDFRRRIISHLQDVRNRAAITSAPDLVAVIMRHCLNSINQFIPEESQFAGFQYHDFLEVFQAAISDVANKESELFKKFRITSEEIFEKPQEKDRQKSLDGLFNITEESKLLAEIKDIRDELNIILTTLTDQEKIIVDMSREASWLKEAAGMAIVEDNINKVKRIDDYAMKTYNALNELLNLKQTEANAWEARFARGLAQKAEVQGKVVLAFTIVTIFSVPLSFLTSFLALGITQFPKDSTGATVWNLKLVLPLILGVSLVTSFFIVGLVMFNIGYFHKRDRQHVSKEAESLEGANC